MINNFFDKLKNKLPKNKVELRHFLYRIALVIFGSFILGIGNGLFLIPYNIVAGGVSGISIVLHEIWNYLEIEAMTFVLTWGFFFIGWFILGSEFAFKTILSTIVYPVSVLLGTFLHDKGVAFNASDLAGMQTFNLLAALFGGIAVGIGVGLTFKGGGSTGGVDVIALTIQKFTGVKVSIPTFIVDASIVVAGYIVYKDLALILMGIISAFVCSIMIDKIFDTENNVCVHIISKEYLAINEEVIKRIDRGSTIVSATGGYSSQEVKVVQVVLNYREYYILQDIVAKLDKTAFMYMFKVSSVRGEGFKAHVLRK